MHSGPLSLQDLSFHLAPVSLFLLDKHESGLRRVCIQAINWKPFDWFFLLAILANCVVLALDTPKPGQEDSQLGNSLRLANYVFIALFTLEAVLKIIALGFLLAPYTYLRDGELQSHCGGHIPMQGSYRGPCGPRTPARMRCEQQHAWQACTQMQGWPPHGSGAHGGNACCIKAAARQRILGTCGMAVQQR